MKEDEETLKSQGRVFFQPGEKRKVAFIKREVSRAVCLRQDIR